MRQIYDFERTRPPVLTQKQLRTETERRKLCRQTTLLAVSAVLMVLCLLLSALLLIPVNFAAAILCGIYAAVSLTGSSVLTIVFIQKRRELVPCDLS